MNAANRALWAVIALLFIIAGGLGVAAGMGVLPPIDRNTAVLAPQFLDRWRSIGGWAWAALIVAGLLLALLGLGLLRAQLRRRAQQMNDLTEGDLAEQRGAEPKGAEPKGAEPQSPELKRAERKSVAGADGRLPGFTRVRTAALIRGMERDLARHPTVRNATVALAGRPKKPALQARLDVAPDTDLGQLRHYVTSSIDRLNATSGLRPAAVRVVVRLRDVAAARAR